jgi:predicted lipoprotein
VTDFALAGAARHRRRALLFRAGVLALGVALPSLGGCQRLPARKRVLAALVEGLAVPDTRELVRASRALETALGELLRSPTVPALSAARAGFRASLLAWQRAACFKNGPIVETRALLRALFWPCKTAALDALLESSRLSLAELTVNQKGLFAIEHLLFAGGSDARAVELLLTSGAGERRRSVLFGLSHQVTECAEATQSALGDGRSFARTFAAREQESLNLLVNQMVASVESVVAERGAILRSEAPPPKNQLQGGPSESAVAIANVRISGAHRLYSAGSSDSLAGLVSAVSPPIHAQVELAFARAEAALGVLSELATLERPPTLALRAAATAARELERVLKVDLANALGVSLIFTGADAD